MAAAPLVILLYDRTFCAGSFKAALLRRPWFYAALAARGNGSVRDVDVRILQKRLIRQGAFIDTGGKASVTKRAVLASPRPCVAGRSNFGLLPGEPAGGPLRH